MRRTKKQILAKQPWLSSDPTAMPASTTLDDIPVAIDSIDFNQQQALSFRIENTTSDPVSPAIGEIWLRTDL